MKLERLRCVRFRRVLEDFRERLELVYLRRGRGAARTKSAPLMFCGSTSTDEAEPRASGRVGGAGWR